MNPPHNVAGLERALAKMAKTNEDGVNLRRVVANVIVGQFLDGAVMRGGGSLKLRYGLNATRYTMDFDASRSISEDEFVERFSNRLSGGWADFTGRLLKKPKPRPKDVLSKYVMQPFEVKLAYRNHPWCTVELEVSYDEVGDADDADLIGLSKDILELFAGLGFPEPKPFPLMKISHQVAQKLHGATDVDYVRAQDLIDLQLMLARENVDFREVNQICKRLFANRKKQPWPTRLTASEEWQIAYEAVASQLPVLPTVDEAVAWANDLIAQIDAAR